LAYIAGAASMIIAQVVGHHLAISRERSRWEREAPDREANRRHAYRRELVVPILEGLDTLLRPTSLDIRIEGVGLGEAVKQHLREIRDEAMQVYQEDAKKIASKLLERVPSISDPDTQSKLEDCLVLFLVSSDVRDELLQIEGGSHKEVVADCYQSLERYVVSE